MSLVSKKALPILLLNILKEYSDENHFLTQQEISDLLYKEYDLEIERKTIGSTLTLLEELDYDIYKNPAGKGVCLLTRDFEQSEIQYIIDAIFSSKSIGGKEAKDVATKVMSCLSKYQRKDYRYLNKTSEINRTTNHQVFLNIEIISEAIKKQQNIKFKYESYNKKGEKCYKYHDWFYTVSPYFLVNNFGKYYLICHRKYNKFTIFRLDYIAECKIDTESKFLPLKEIEEVSPTFNISDYMNEHIYLFNTEVKTFEMKILKPFALNYIYDWFGKNAKLIKNNDDLFIRLRCDETAFFYWAMQYGEYIELLAPLEMKEKLVKAAENIINKYKNI